MMSESIFDMINRNNNNAAGVADDAQGNLEAEFQTIVPGGYLGNVEIWSKQIDKEDGPHSCTLRWMHTKRLRILILRKMTHSHRLKTGKTR
jgi:SPX domain protein involved in polyphosphate accumulation